MEVEALPFLHREEAFSDAVLDVTIQRLRTFLQRQGHLLAKVSGEVTGDAARRTLHLAVDPGPIVRIVEVKFPGLHSLSGREIRERVGARRGRPWRWGGEPVDDESLAADASSLQATLQDAGFADAKVEPARLVPVAGGVEIDFAVDEGTCRLVKEVAVEGFPPSVAQPKIGLVAGGPWSASGEETARLLFQETLQEAGWIDAVVAASHSCTGELCSVVLRTQPGIPTVVGRVVIAGLVRTSRRVVEKVAGLHEGQVAGPQAQLAAERRLFGLGIFQRATVRPIPGQDGGPRRGLLLDLTEGPTRGVSFGLGWDTEQKARVSVLWSELSLFGSARSLSAEARFSSREQRFQVTYKEPASLGLLKVPTWVSVYRTEEHFGTYDLLRRGTLVEFGDRTHRPARVLLRYEYQIVDPTASPDVLSQLERDKQQARIASLSPILEWDTRDDLFSPRRGVFASLQWQSAFKILLADAAFNKVTASAAAFTPLAGGVLGGAIHAGSIQPHDRAAGVTDNLLVPLAVRFFAGGRVSNRAFPTDLLGIPGKTLGCQQASSSLVSTSDCTPEPTGGAGLLLASLEWRVRVWGPIGANFFVDGGNVWAAWRDIRPADMRWGGGLGVRVETPVGPLRLEYGWKFRRQTFVIDALRYQETPGELFLSFGNPF
jgi:outer membrane protein assembly factor BamA